MHRRHGAISIPSCLAVSVLASKSEEIRVKMSKARKAAVLLFVAVLTFSMFMSPIGPAVQAEVAGSPTLSPEAQDQLDQWMEQMAQPGFSAKVDAYLATWMETGELSDMVVTKQNGDVSALVVTAPNVNIDAIREVVHVDWFVNLVAMQTIAISASSPDQIAKLAEIEGVGIIDADIMRSPIKNDLVKEIDIASTTPGEAVDMDIIKEVVGATSASSTFTVNGDGVLVGLVDTGTDFGNPALQDAFSEWTYDPTGEGLTFLKHANSTVVNATAWTMDGGLLTYTNASGTFLNVTGWDPLLNNEGGGRYLFGDGDPTHAYRDRVGFIWLYTVSWGVAIEQSFLDDMWMDWELPAPADVYGNYSVNWIYQQHHSPYAKLFAPALSYNATADKLYKLVVDWEGADAWNMLWTGGIYYETLNLTAPAVKADILGRMDFNYTDDEVFSLANPIVSVDYTDDGVDDFSLGALSWCYDGLEWFDDDPMFNGFRDDGDAFCLFTDDGMHGTATASHIAGNGFTFYNSDNETYFDMEGIAPGAKVMSVRALSGQADYGAYLWVCGFDLNETSGEFYWTGAHTADVVSNSWGWVTEPSSQFDYLSFTWEILAAPDILDASYDGVLHVFSAGNEGSGFMTIGPPGAATGILTVGASTTSHWLDYLYGPDQMDYEAIASFSSKGPSFSGYVKPDVVVPGLAGYAASPWFFSYYAADWVYVSSDNYTLFSGTSQSAPVAAGVAALLIEKLNDNAVSWTPSMVKNIIQSTATDLGYDPATQGFGRIDAYDAIDFAVNGGLVTANQDSYNYFVQLIGDAWAYWGMLPSSITGVYVNESTTAFPTDMWDGSVFFGEVYPGDTSTVHLDLYDTIGDFYGTALASGPIAETSTYFREVETFMFFDSTFSYNDTDLTPQQMYGFYNLSEAIGAAYDTAEETYSYMTVAVSFDAAEVAGDEPWMFLYDWTDVNDDGMPNLWNATAGTGNELTRITSSGDESNTNMLPFATADTDFDAVLEGDITLVIHDPSYDADMTYNATAYAHDFNVTVIFWEEVSAASYIGFTDTGTGSNTFNVTFTAPTDYGIFQGYLDFDGLKVPWSAMVKANISAADGAVNLIVDASDGEELNPYDDASYGCMEADPDDWDFRTYAIHVPYAAADYLGVRVIWDSITAGNNMYVQVLDNMNFVLGEGGMSTLNTTAVIAEIDGVGDYYIFIHALAVDGSDGLPVGFDLEVMWYSALTNEDLVLSYTADDALHPNVISVADLDTVWGDHAVLNASYPDFNLPNMPEFEVTWIQIGFLSGVYHHESGSLVIPAASYDPFSGPVQLDQFAWERVDGIVEGDNVALSVDFTNGDCDIMAWWAGTDNTTWSYANNVLGAVMATGNHPEAASFVAGQSGSLMIGIFDYDLAPGTWTVTLDTRVGVYDDADGPEVTYDSYEFLRNGTFQVQILAETDTNIGYEINYAALTFENFFSPELLTVNVTGTGLVKTVTWTYDDLNAGDEHFFEVLLSADSGASYQLLATNITTSSYVWDSTGFTELLTYKIMIRVYDNDPIENEDGIATGVYWTGLSDMIESATFGAGNQEPIVITTSTTTTTTTTTSVPPEDPNTIIILGLIAGIGAGVVVVLILFLIRRR
jgi:hypothetical protein